MNYISEFHMLFYQNYKEMFPGLAQNMKVTYVFLTIMTLDNFGRWGQCVIRYICIRESLQPTTLHEWSVSMFLTNWIILNIVLFIFFFGGFFSDHIDPIHSLSGGTIRQIKTCFNIKNPFPERYPYFRSMAIK